MTNLLFNIVDNSNTFFANTSNEDAIIAVTSNTSTLFIGASNTSNFISIAPGATRVNNDLSVVGKISASALEQCITDSVTTSNSNIAASASAVRLAYSFACNALPKTGGTVTGDITLSTAGVQVLGAAADTLSNPSFSWSGNSNTGIYRVAANQVGIATNGTNALTISSSNAAFASQITSRAAQGTAPLVVTSTTLVSNLNANFLDGSNASTLKDLANANGFLQMSNVSNASIPGDKLTGKTGTGITIVMNSNPTFVGTVSMSNDLVVGGNVSAATLSGACISSSLSNTSSNIAASAAAIKSVYTMVSNISVSISSNQIPDGSITTSKFEQITGTGAVVLNNNPTFTTFSITNNTPIANLNASFVDGSNAAALKNLANANGFLQMSNVSNASIPGDKLTGKTGTGNTIVMNSNPTFVGNVAMNNDLVVGGNVSAATLSGACISSSVNSTSNNIAASAAALKTAYELASNALPKTGGTVSGDIILSNVGIQVMGAAADDATNPSFSWSGNSNTGIYRAAANQVGVATNGTNALTISSSNAAFASQITSKAAQGTAPLVVTSTTLVSNLNANFLDGSNASALKDLTNANGFLQMSNVSNASIPGDKLTGKTGTGNTIVMNSNPTFVGNVAMNNDLVVGGNVSAATLSGACISSSVNATTSNVAASAAALKTAYELASNALPKTGGTVSGDIILSNVGIQVLGVAADDATNPSFSWSGNSNTGIYRVAANQVGVATNGTNALTISSSNAAFASQITSKAAQGTAPLVVTSTTLVSNLNANFLDGSNAAALKDLTNANGFLQMSNVSNASITSNKFSAFTGTGAVVMNSNPTLTTFNVSGDEITINNVKRKFYKTVINQPPAAIGSTQEFFSITGNWFRGTKVNIKIFGALDSSITAIEGEAFLNYNLRNVNTGWFLFPCKINLINPVQFFPKIIARYDSVAGSDVLKFALCRESGSDLSTYRDMNVEITIETTSPYTGTLTVTDLSSNAVIVVPTVTTQFPQYEVFVGNLSMSNDLVVGGNVSAATLSGTCISSLVNSTSSNVAASAAALKTAYELATNALPKTGGTVSGDIILSNVGIQVMGAAADDATNPSFSWSGNSNTGIYRAAANQVGVATNGTNALTISSSNAAFASQITSRAAQGTAPLVVTSTTLVSNLNASLLDGSNAAALKNLANANGFLQMSNVSNASITSNKFSAFTGTGAVVLNSNPTLYIGDLNTSMITGTSNSVITVGVPAETTYVCDSNGPVTSSDPLWNIKNSNGKYNYGINISTGAVNSSNTGWLQNLTLTNGSRSNDNDIRLVLADGFIASSVRNLGAIWNSNSNFQYYIFDSNGNALPGYPDNYLLPLYSNILNDLSIQSDSLSLNTCRGTGTINLGNLESRNPVVTRGLLQNQTTIELTPAGALQTRIDITNDWSICPNEFRSNAHDSQLVSVPMTNAIKDPDGFIGNSTVYFSGGTNSNWRMESVGGINRGNVIDIPWNSNTDFNLNTYSNITPMVLSNANNGIALGITLSMGRQDLSNNTRSNTDFENYVIFSMSNSSFVVEVARSGPDIVFAYKKGVNSTCILNAPKAIWDGSPGNKNLFTGEYNAYAFVVDKEDNRMKIYKNGYLYASSNIPSGYGIVATSNTSIPVGKIKIGATANNANINANICGITQNANIHLMLNNVTISSNTWNSNQAKAYATNQFKSMMYNMYCALGEFNICAGNGFRFIADALNTDPGGKVEWEWKTGHPLNDPVMSLTKVGDLTIGGGLTSAGDRLTLSAQSNVVINTVNGLKIGNNTDYGIDYTTQAAPLQINQPLKVDGIYSNWHVNIITNYVNNVNGNNPNFYNPFTGLILTSGNYGRNHLLIASGGNNFSGNFSVIQSANYSYLGNYLLLNPDGGYVGIGLGTDLPDSRLHVNGDITLNGSITSTKELRLKSTCNVFIEKPTRLQEETKVERALIIESLNEYVNSPYTGVGACNWYLNPNQITNVQTNTALTSNVVFKNGSSSVQFAGSNTWKMSVGYGPNCGNVVYIPAIAGLSSSNTYSNTTSLILNNANQGLSLGITWANMDEVGNYVIYSMSNTSNLIEIGKSNSDLLFWYKKSTSNAIYKLTASNALSRDTGNHGYINTRGQIYDSFAFVIDSSDAMEIYKNGSLLTSSNLPTGFGIVSTIPSTYAAGKIKIGSTAHTANLTVTPNATIDMFLNNFTIAPYSWSATEANNYFEFQQSKNSLYNLYSVARNFNIATTESMNFIMNTFMVNNDNRKWNWIYGHPDNTACMSLTKDGDLTFQGILTGNKVNLGNAYGNEYSNQGVPLFISQRLDKSYSNWYPNFLNTYHTLNPTLESPYSGMIISAGDANWNAIFIGAGGNPTSKFYAVIQGKHGLNGGTRFLLLNPDGATVAINTANDSLIDASSALFVNGKITASSVYAGTTPLTSDDRIKSDEIFIENATETLLKLRPQTYNKWSTMDYINNCNAKYVKESGIIAQEIFYDAPELRHLVTVPEGSDSNIYDYVPSSSNPQEDPVAYGLWGSNVASVNYTGLIPYLIKAVQEKDEELRALTSRIQSLEEKMI